MIGFQNCQDQRHIINIASRRESPVTNANAVEILFLPETGSNTVRILADDFIINTLVRFDLKTLAGQEATLEQYNNFEWFIYLYDLSNMEKTLVNQQITSQSNYEWTFNSLGVYDISATLTSEDGSSVNANRVIVIGQCENPSESPLFFIDKNPDSETSFYVARTDGEAINITNGLWELRHNGQNVESNLFNVNQHTGLTLAGLDILEEDVITLEFFTQLENENCITDT